MFKIDTNGNISLSVGDTASFTVAATGYTFGEDDRALFTIRDAAGQIIMENYYALDGDTNGEFLVQIHNEDTDRLTPGAYSYDVRYIIGPYWEGGRIVDGDQVITPKAAATFQLLSVVGEV